MLRLSLSIGLIVCLAVSLAACSSRTVKSANHVPVQRVTQQIPEQYLLDVGVEVFDTGLDQALDDEDLLIFPEVRKAEARYMPFHLMDTLQDSAAWGAVRVVPQDKSTVDVRVKGKILQSDGEMLVLHIQVSDSSGRRWFSKNYEGVASKYAYDRRRQTPPDPFQGIYNRIANDMLDFRQKLKKSELAGIRDINRLRFAEEFAPSIFDDYLEKNKKGRYEIVRLPATNDPMMERLERIRRRDYLFVDTLQNYYGNFVREMDSPYREWRKQTYEEVIKMRRLQRQSRNRTIAGIASIIGGIAAAGSNNGSVATAGQVGVVGGGYLVKSGFDKNAQSKIHVEALQELGNSLEAEIQPQVIELEDRTITLTGTVENQYDQWRSLLREIYQLDTQGTAD